MLALLLAYVSPYVPPKATWFFAFFGLGFPFLLVINALFFFMWLAFKPKYAVMSGLFLALGFGAIQRAIGFNPADTTSEGFEVMTYNIGKTREDFHYKDRQDKIDRFQRFIANRQPDIICIQERLPKHLDYYKQIFLGYNLHPNSETGTTIYSKYPFVKTGNLAFDTYSHNATWADIKIKGSIFRIYAVHLSSNYVPKLSDNVKEIWDDSKSILDRYNHHAIKRVDQLKEILAHAEQSPYPVVISGDFNDVPQSYVYRMISEEYQDAFTVCGKGLGQTFNSKFWGLRIDYSFASEEAKILDHKIVRSPISDHYPVVTTIALDPKT